MMGNNRYLDSGTVAKLGMLSDLIEAYAPEDVILIYRRWIEQLIDDGLEQLDYYIADPDQIEPETLRNYYAILDKKDNK